MEKEITLKLPASIVQLVIAALGKQPFETVAPAINMIVAQANPQMLPPGAAPAPEPEPEISGHQFEGDRPFTRPPKRRG